MAKTLPLKAKRQPGICPYFRGKGRHRVQDGYRVSWYEPGAAKPARQWVKTAEEAELLRSTKATAFALAPTGLRQVTTCLRQEHMPHVENALRILDQHHYLNFDEPAEAGALVDAVNWFVAKYEPPRADMLTVDALVALFLQAKAGKAVQTRRDYKKNLQIFAHTKCDQVRLGARPADAVTTKHISEFLQSRPVGLTTKAKYYGAVRALFYFACTESEHLPQPLLKKNPALAIYDPPAPTVPRRHRYTLEEVQRLVQVSIYLRCAPVVILRLFTMLREDEARRLILGPPLVGKRKPGRPRRNDPWEFIDLARGKLDYHEENESDPANRAITLYPALIAWLKFFQSAGIALKVSRREADARRLAAPAKYDHKRFTNLIRHTAISFRAAKCKSLIETADEADNTEKVIRDHYYTKVTPEDAEAFYELTPDKFDLRPYTDPTFPSAAQLKELGRSYHRIEKVLKPRS